MRLDQVRPSRIMTAVEKALRTSFCGGAGLEPGGAGDGLRSGVDRTEQVVGRESQLGLRVGRHEGGDRAQLARRARARSRRRACAPTRSADGDVAGAQARSLGAARPRRRPRRSRRPAGGPPAARVVGGEQASGALNVGSSSAASRTARRPDVPPRSSGRSLPPAARRRWRRRAWRGRAGPRRPPGRPLGVLAVEQLQHLQGGQGVDSPGPGVAVLGRRAHPHITAHAEEVSFLRAQSQ